MPSSTSPRGVDASDGSGILGFTSALRSQLAGSQSKFDSWVEGQKARADEAAAAHAELPSVMVRAAVCWRLRGPRRGREEGR